MKILILFIFTWIVLFALRTLYQAYIFYLFHAVTHLYRRLSGFVQFTLGCLYQMIRRFGSFILRFVLTFFLAGAVQRVLAVLRFIWKVGKQYGFRIFNFLAGAVQRVLAVLRFIWKDRKHYDFRIADVLVRAPQFFFAVILFAFKRIKSVLPVAEGLIFRVQRLPAPLKTGLALLFSGLVLVGGFIVVMQWVEPMFPALVRSTLFFFSSILAFIILRYFAFFTKTVTGAALLVFLLLFETIIFRPFVFSHAVFFPLLLASMTAGIAVWSWISSGNVLHKAIRMAAVFYGAVPFLILLSMRMGYHGTHKCEQVKKNTDIRFLLDFCSSSWRKEIIKRTGYSEAVLDLNAEARSIFLSSDGRIVFTGTGLQDDRGQRLLFAIDRRSRKILKVFKMATPWRGVCMEGVCAVMVPVERKVYLLDEKRLVVKKKIKLNLQPLWFATDAVSEKFFMPWMVGDDLAILNLKEGKVKEYSFKSIRRYTYPFGVAQEVEYNRHTRRLYMVTERYFSRPCLYRYSFPDPDAAPEFDHACFSYGDMFLSLGPALGLAMDEKKKEIYMAVTLEGSVYVIQEEGLKRIRKIPVGVGVRELTFDSRRGVLYAANYITGEIVGISPSSGKIIKKIFVGRRIRQINYEPRIDRLLAASANGFMEIRLD